MDNKRGYWLHITDKLSYVVKEYDSAKFVIYPCGERGMMTKEVLNNVYHIQEAFLIDNKKSETDSNFMRLDDLINIDCSKYIFLIASDAKEIYKEIREDIRKYVSKNNIFDLFPRTEGWIAQNYIKKKGDYLRDLLWKILFYDDCDRNAFLKKQKNCVETRLLDVGCGNYSPQVIKRQLDKIYYIGVDVGDYAQTVDSISYADEYHIVTPDEFAQKIESFERTMEVVVSNHNIEHCNQPERVLRAMARSLKKGGKLYMAFPSEESAFFPGVRKGCLNFYDDNTHARIPEWDRVINILQENGMKIITQCKNHRPYGMCRVGAMNEYMSKELDNTLPGTWEYWGFESIIWAVKK